MKRTTLLGVCLACGCAGKAPPGQNRPDSGAGAGADGDVAADALNAPVTLTVLGLGGELGPNAGATVSFADATGVPTTMTMTDANGKASGMVPAGGSVTVAVIGPTNDAVWIATGVKPGDDLTIGAASSVPDGTVNVTLPAAVTNAVSYQIATGGAGRELATPAAVTAIPLVTANVDGDGKYGVIALAADMTGKVIATSAMFDLAAPGANQTSAVVLDAFNTTFDSATITTVNLPATATDVRANIATRSKAAVFYQLYLAQTMTGPVFTFPLPHAAWDGYQEELDIDGPNCGSALRKALTAVPADNVDLTADALPFIAGLQVAAVANALPTVQWQAYATPVLGMSARVSYPDAGGHSAQLIIAFLPTATQTSLVPPQLPAELALFLPGAAPIAGAGLDAYGGSLYASPDAFRAAGPLTAFDTPLPNGTTFQDSFVTTP